MACAWAPISAWTLSSSCWARGGAGGGAVATVLCIVYAVIVTYGGFLYVRKMHEVGILMQDMPVQQWIPRVILPIGFALLALRFGQVLYRLATGAGRPLAG